MSMPRYQLSISLSEPLGPAPRIWIDDPSDPAPNVEREVPLTVVDASTWDGTFVPMRASQSESLLFRVWLCGTPGCHWSMRIVRDGRVLYEDADRLGLMKEWVVGTFPIAAAVRAAHGLSMVNSNSDAARAPVPRIADIHHQSIRRLGERS